MDISSSSQQIKIATISVTGRLDAVRSLDLRREIGEALADDTVRIVVDLSAAEFVDSAGLAALAKGMKDCRSRGGDLRVVAATNPDAARVFALTRFDQVFTMAATAEELVSSW